ncbi:hypothetical protein OR1_03642 [Geobacter sp. OR-1]|uniref:hypothetical protein n=1 Tax=Geobacter sp. OR-1 TaxID=1266765 RepID=UPI000541F30F|nr:hypothetical protein [Geobacter sp. OR-1]GAM11329.1 hypothetical protein OR1_03642 [Geobacter sp. OR-1]
MRVVEKRVSDGAYDMTYDEVIMDTEAGRFYASEGRGVNEIGGETYRWSHGIGIRLKADDNFATLGSEWNECITLLEAARGGYDPERPLVTLDFEAVRALI